MLWHCSIFKTAVGNMEIHELIIMWRSFVCVCACVHVLVYLHRPLLAHYWALYLLATETQSPLMEVQLNGSVKWFASLKLPCYTDTNFPLLHFYRLSSRVCICGYPRQQMRRYKGISTRLTVTSEFLVQLITGIHYALWVPTHVSTAPLFQLNFFFFVMPQLLALHVKNDCFKQHLPM